MGAFPSALARAARPGALPAWAGALDRAADLDRAFGPTLTWLSLELRPGGRVDLATCVARPDAAALARHAAASEPLAPAAAFARWWADGAGGLPLPTAWFEFDARRAVPLVFAALARGPADALPDAEQAIALLDAAPTFRDALSAEVLATARRVLAALPAGAIPLHLASLAPRGLAALRLVATVPLAALDPWLDAIGWPGPRGRARTLATRAGAFGSHLNVHLDLGPAVGPGLAVELFWRDPGDRRWNRVLDALPVDADRPLVDAGRRWTSRDPRRRRLQVKLVLAADGSLAARPYLAQRGG